MSALLTPEEVAELKALEQALGDILPVTVGDEDSLSGAGEEKCAAHPSQPPLNTYAAAIWAADGDCLLGAVDTPAELIGTDSDPQYLREKALPAVGSFLNAAPSLLKAAELLPLLAEALEPFAAKADLANGLAPFSRTSAVRFKAGYFRQAEKALEAYRQALGEAKP